MNTGPRLTYYPAGVLLTAPYDAQLTPALVGELKRLIPQHGRRYLPDTREWFVVTAYEAQARAIFRSCWPHFEEDEGTGDDPSQRQPRDPRPPLAVARHYAALQPGGFVPMLAPGVPMPQQPGLDAQLLQAQQALYGR